MPSTPNAQPTPITPPRVPFIDERTGLIDRAWYMFFLSLFNAASDADDVKKTPDVNSALASYDAALRALEAQAFTQPLPAQFDEAGKQIQSLALQPPLLTSQLDELGKRVQALECLPAPREFKRARYGQFLDTTVQLAGAANTPQAITFDTTEVSWGVTIGSPTSRIYVDEPSIYNFLFSIQLDKTNGGTAIFWVWPRVNGVDVPNSNSQVQIQGNNAEQLVTVGYFFDLKAGDYVEIMFAVNDVSVQVQAFPAAAFYPAIPSIILTVTNNIKGVQ